MRMRFLVNQVLLPLVVDSPEIPEVLVLKVDLFLIVNSLVIMPADLVLKVVSVAIDLAILPVSVPPVLEPKLEGLACPASPRKIVILSMIAKALRLESPYLHDWMILIVRQREILWRNFAFAC